MHTGPPPARTSHKALALVATLFALFALVLGGAGPAFAHTGLSGSDPADGTVLKTAPQHVTLTFTESVGFSEDSLRVLSPDNERVNPRQAHHVDGQGNTARVELSGTLPQGTYTVAWRVVSADGHPISGAFVFSIGRMSETAAVVATGSPDDTAASRAYGFFRHVAYSGLALLVGAAAFVLVCWPGAAAARPVRRLLVTGWAMLVASTAALLLLRGPYETAGPITSVFDLSDLGRTVTGRPGLALLARLALLAAAAVWLRSPALRLDPPDEGPRQRDPGARVRQAGALLAVGLAFTWAAAEHASAGIQVPLAVPVSVLHLLAMGVWLGGLITLVLLLRHRGPGGRDVPAAAIGRFSTLAFTAVAVLVATGVYQSWRQVGSWEALTTTSYGRILIVKIAAVVLVLCAASFARRWTARLAPGEPPAAEWQVVPERRLVSTARTIGAPASPESTGAADSSGASAGGEPGDDTGTPPAPQAERYRRGLRRTVTAEAVLGVVVLAITTLLTGTQPSRAAGGTAAAATAREPQAKVVTVPFDMGTAGRSGTAQITLAPGRVGENTVEVVVFSADGGLATVPELRLTLTQEDQGIGPLDARLKNQKGYWAAYDLRLPMPGEWTLNLTVRTTDIDQVTVRESVRITASPR
ncbi:copper resistance CopC/CopD family protein [Streptomyces antarcticus]|uniref:copper resistance CopC/CopD family protein n=1 Tax=Streptomyces antarcticus TaxID=2996458 RepID=UPI002270AE77|nr:MULTISPECIES: copper resistance protein CopC [unclassified Streptomyces]MCY0939926.1 copper resistance protein CopC [Streptomyces sp. H34-AA3]MCZ4086415.1 copper resistance protein CopC [Streptomyces sp. H34-S5]